MASEMVERVARAICVSNGKNPDLRFYGADSEPEWMMYQDDARAAIAAMREPTKAMAKAATGHVTIQSVWRAMADEALK